MSTRIEADSLGEVEVPQEALWGAQTQRSLQNFPIGRETMPQELIRAFAIVKMAAAETNRALGKLDDERCQWIKTACREILAGDHYQQFPLVIWQTGSGTQSNMNANEVIANRANELAGTRRGSKTPVHPNDHVNMSQSSNDFFPTAMHVAAACGFNNRLLPRVAELIHSLKRKAHEFQDVVKIGRTHMMDATPLTLGQEISGYVAQLQFAEQQLKEAQNGLVDLALGGTAVGTGLNSHPAWAAQVAHNIAVYTNLPFDTADNKFMGLSAHDALLKASGALRQLASACMVIGSNIRLLASGPRCGIGELLLPANEPGSSIMPGKVNPTQCEALTQVAVQVIGNDTAVSVACSQGHLQLNVFKPLIIYNVLQSIQLLTDACDSFAKRCVDGMEANRERIDHHLNRSLMLVTALSPQLGYDTAAEIAKQAYTENKTLKQVVLERNLLTEKEFDLATDPRGMLGPHAPNTP
jgi:fumarate hydratase class II